jgi:hypothetical protein
MDLSRATCWTPPMFYCFQYIRQEYVAYLIVRSRTCPWPWPLATPPGRSYLALDPAEPPRAGQPHGLAPGRRRRAAHQRPPSPWQQRRPVRAPGGVPPGARRGVPHDLLRARLEAKAKAELTEASATVRVGQPVTGLGDTTVKLPGTSAISMGYRGRGGFPRQALPAAPALPGSRCLLRACRAARRP